MVGRASKAKALMVLRAAIPFFQMVEVAVQAERRARVLARHLQPQAVLMAEAAQAAMNDTHPLLLPQAVRVLRAP